MRNCLLLLLVACHKPSPQATSPVREIEEDFVPFAGSSWQEAFKEEAQTFEDYVGIDPHRPHGKKRIFYIQPLGELTEKERGAVEAMREYAEVYFGLTAKVCDPIPMFENGYVKSRKQYNSSMLIGQLTERMPEDAVVYIGITHHDLFADNLNFVFGQGSLRDGTGVYSLLRYETSDEKLYLRRALKLMAHEVGHIFSIHHCITWQCVMNGANSLREDDEHPMHLCPIDLKKLQWSIGFDWLARYDRLREFYVKHGLKSEADWTALHLSKLRK